MDLGLENKIDLVTGGSRGIGREIALSFAAEGARLAVTYHSERAEAERVAAQAADGIAVAMDLELPATIGAAIDEVVAHHGGIDVLVVNAVRWPAENSERFEDQSPGEWRAVLRANLEGAFETVHRSLPAMRSRAWGRVVFVSSEIAESGYPTVWPYAAAKAGLHGFARTLAWDLGRDGVLVNVVAAGGIRNGKQSPQHTPGTARSRRAPCAPAEDVDGTRCCAHGRVARIRREHKHHG
jgi:NAD(P)-dependent dehydrogenase (short-subunit alcohol dehydrogenase family)